MRRVRISRILCIIVVLLVSLSACQPEVKQVPEGVSLEPSPSPAHPAAASSLEDRLAAHVRYLSSGDCSGRRVTSEGDRKAASYVADEFKAMGLKPLFGSSFVKEIPAERIAESQSRLEVLDDKGAVLKSFTYFWGFAESYFPGYGETRVTGKIAIGTDQMAALKSPTVLLIQATSSEALSWGRRTAGTKCVALLFADPNAKPDSEPLRGGTWPVMSGVPVPILQVQPSCYEDLAKRAGETVRVSVTAQDLSSKQAWNVGAMLGDPAKQETIVVLAHRDHMGTLPDGTVFPGAVDNASGVSAVIEIARELKSADLKKAIVFLTVDGEEVGGIGSRHFIENLPFPGKNLFVALNLDCLAVRGEGPVALCSGGGQQAAGLASAVRQLLTEAGFEIIVTRPEDLSSDHMGFIAAGYPAVGMLSTIDSMGAYLHKRSDGPDAVDLKELSATTIALVKAIQAIAK